MMFILIMVMLATSLANAKYNQISYDPKDKFEKINYRLPQNIKPIRYTMSLEPNLEPNFHFTGMVNIELQALENTNNITLHTYLLNITENSMAIMHSSGSEIKFYKTSTDDHRNFYIIHLENHLLKGEKYNLTINHYVGTLNHNDNAGFYLAKYHDRNGNERRFATTQFQSIGARRAFPCFDEPHMKARFIVNLIRTQQFISISNENITRSTYLGNGRYQDSFKETPEMPTYLVALVVTDYSSTNMLERHRVFADTEAIKNKEAQFSLKNGVAVLKALEKYFKIPYSLSKIDQIAIPDYYFAPGAMENWGLVTYKKSRIVFPFKEATVSDKQDTVTLISHEFSHQWFGNLVTCSWWKYIWLNEGFAHFFQYYLTSKIRPNWKLMDQFVFKSLQSALELEKSSNEPMNSETDYPGGGPSTWIAYQKSGSIIRMFQHFLSERIFRKGIQKYLLQNSFGTVEPKNLYDALQGVVNAENEQRLLGNLTVTEILTMWDSQAGCPVVTVTRNYTTGLVTFSQKQYFYKELTPEQNSIWYIPINYVFHANKAHNFENTLADFWLTEKQQSLNDSFSTDSWIIVNKQQTGYYRVQYDMTNWYRIIHHLRNGNLNDIHFINRAQLIDDSFDLASVGQLTYFLPFNLSLYLIKETEYLPLSSFLTSVEFLREKLSGQSEYGIFQRYIDDSVNAAVKYLGFEPKPSDGHVDKLNRFKMLSWACNVGNMDCRRHSLNAFRNWKQNRSASIAVDLEEPIFCGAMRIGNQDDWNFLFQQYERSRNELKRKRILNSLSCSENAHIINRFLYKIVDGTIKKEDRFVAILKCANAGNVGLNATFEFIIEHFDKLVDRLFMGSVLTEIGTKFNTDEQLKKLNDLADKHVDKKYLFTTAIGATKNNIKWVLKYGAEIKQWLNDYSNVKQITNIY